MIDYNIMSKYIGRYSQIASYKKGVGTTQLPTKNECSNQATATKKTYAKAMIVVKLG